MDIATMNRPKLYYTAVLERGSDGYYIHFPDLPGCVSAGDSLQDAALNAEIALALHVSGMVEDGEALPMPSNPTDIPADPDTVEAGRLLIGVDPDAAEKARINIMMDRPLLAAIDAVSDNRSRFLSEAAKDKLRGMLGDG